MGRPHLQSADRGVLRTNNLLLRQYLLLQRAERRAFARQEIVTGLTSAPRDDRSAVSVGAHGSHSKNHGQ